MVLPDDLKTSYTSELSFTPEQLNFGFSSVSRFNIEKERSLKLLISSGKLAEVGQRFFESSNSDGVFTLSKFIDSLIASAIKYSIYNAQFYEDKATKMTSHCQKAWFKYDSRQVWDYLSTRNNEQEDSLGFVGAPLGTLAYYFAYTDDLNLEIDEALNKCLTTFWSMVGGNYELLPAERHKRLVNAILPSQKVLEEVKATLLEVLYLDFADQDHVCRAILNRYLVGPEDFNNLGLRMLLGRYNNALVKVLNILLADERSRSRFNLNDQHSLEEVEDKILSLVKPVGMPLVYIAFLVEALLKLATSLNRYPNQEIPFDTFISFRNEPIKEECTHYLALAVDACSLLFFYDTFSFAEEALVNYKTLLDSWLSNSYRQSIPLTSNYRLGGAFK